MRKDRTELRSMVNELVEDMKHYQTTPGIKTKEDQMLEAEKKRNPSVTGMIMIRL